MRMKTNILSSSAIALTLLSSAGVSCAHAQSAPWTFGVISDTQWVVNDDGLNPDSSAVDIVRGVDKQMIKRGVKLVVAVGDLMDNSTPASNAVRSLYAQDLYNNNIGFFPLRGNHESGLTASGTLEAFLYPQIVNGGNNNLEPSIITPAYITGTGAGHGLSATNEGASYGDTPATILADLTTGANAPLAATGASFNIGANFSYPQSNAIPVGGANLTGTNLTGAANGHGGASYSFDYQNMRFILCDQFVDSSLGGNDSSAPAQQSWFSGLVSGTAGASRPLHTIFFSHKNLLGGNHKDNLFGGNITGTDPGDGSGTSYTGSSLTQLNAKKAWEDAFYTAMFNGSVHYCISGHDHHHAESVIKDPLNTSNFVHQVITASDSAKFYTPGTPFSSNEVCINEDLYEIGYYLVTVDGPRITLDYYGVPSNQGGNNLSTTPVLDGNWVKVVTTGYSMNGQETLVASGSSYAGISDNTNEAIANATANGETASNYVGSSFSILAGANGTTLTTAAGRALTKSIDTGWAPVTNDTTGAAISDILNIWGMTNVFAIQTDTVVLQMSIPASYTGNQDNTICLGAFDKLAGAWVNAVDYNIVGGSRNFVSGAYQAGYGLGTWGVDPVAHTVWAVVNGDPRNFAVIHTPTAPLPWAFAGVAGHVGTADLKALAQHLGSSNLAYDLNGDGKVDASDEKWLQSHYTNAGGK
jgi:hypothetical protein